MRRALLVTTVLVLACGLVAAAAPQTELVVFGPHPDDETLGCAGILTQAVAQGKSAKVVLLTSGDGFPALAALVGKKSVDKLAAQDFVDLARFRQNQALQAVTAMGLKAQDLLLLGYPDSALERLYRFEGTAPFRQEFTQRSATYAVIQKDYHTATHRTAAPYTRTALIADLVEILKTLAPKRIYVTDPADVHADHRAAFWFVRDAVKAAGYQGEFYTYLVHGGPEWPYPIGITPKEPLQVHTVDGQTIPGGVAWPPPVRIPLSAQDAEIKLRAIKAHSSHLAGITDPEMAHEREYLESFVKSEEVFWPVK